jgi:hypothetical protein
MSRVCDANEIVGMAKRIGTIRLLIVAIIGLVGFIFFQEYRHNDRYTQIEADNDWSNHFIDHMPSASAHAREVEMIVSREKKPVNDKFKDIEYHLSSIDKRLTKLDELDKLIRTVTRVETNQKIIMKKLNLDGGGG